MKGIDPDAQGGSMLRGFIDRPTYRFGHVEIGSEFSETEEQVFCDITPKEFFDLSRIQPKELRHKYRHFAQFPLGSSTDDLNRFSIPGVKMSGMFHGSDTQKRLTRRNSHLVSEERERRDAEQRLHEEQQRRERERLQLEETERQQSEEEARRHMSVDIH